MAKQGPSPVAQLSGLGVNSLRINRAQALLISDHKKIDAGEALLQLTNISETFDNQVESFFNLDAVETDIYYSPKYRKNAELSKQKL